MTHISPPKLNSWTMFKRLFPIVRSASPNLFNIYLVLFILDAAFFPLSIWAMQYTFDQITTIFTSGGALHSIIWALLLLFAIKIAGQILNGVAYFLAETYDPRALVKLLEQINFKLSKIEPVLFDDPQKLDQIEKANAGARHGVQYINTVIDIVIMYIPQFIFIAIYFFLLKPSLSISILLVFLPVLISQLIRKKTYTRLEDQTSPERRKLASLEQSMVSRDAFKQTRTLGVFSYFFTSYIKSLKQITHLKWQTDFKSIRIEFGLKFITLSGYIGILLLLFFSVINKDISVGAFAAVFASIDRVFLLMEEVINGRLGQYSENFGKIQNYLKLLDFPEREANPQGVIKNVPPAITVDSASFSYPSNSSPTLKNLNFHVNPGESIAIVGPNGSGKTTLARLLIGIYLPSEGTVNHNNVSTQNMSTTELYTNTSSVFQKFAKYQLSVFENIIISESNRQAEPEKVNQTLMESGMNPNTYSYPQGLDTILSKEFDGVDISGGQWQRLAIARGLYRKHQLILLDEPTSAIDPLEETQLYHKFSELSAHHTSLIITHRLGPVKLADRVLVINEGKIVAFDTHTALLKDCLFYKQMWEAQSQFYTSDNHKPISAL